MSATLKTLALSVSAGSLALIAGTASAQNLGVQNASVDNFSRNRNIAVQERARPEYEAPGIRTGAFLVYPRVELSAESDSNIYASETNEVSDTILHVRPELAIESDWSQNFLTAYVRGSVNRYMDNKSEDENEFGVGAAGRIDVTRQANIGFGANYLDGFEQRFWTNAPLNTVEPIGLEVFDAYLSASRSAGYLRLSGRADFRSFDYADGRTPLGAIVDQDFRSRDVRSISGRVDYAISPDTALFVQITGNDREYSVASTALVPNRDSSGTEYLAGANFEVSAQVRGEIAVGYIEQNFDQSAFKDVDGFGARVRLEWFPSELTTVTVAGGRKIDDSPVFGSGGIMSDTLSLGVDHELLRNVILNGRVTWGRDDFAGIDREDTRLGASIGGTYLVNRNFGVNATLSSTDLDSSGVNRDRDFTVNKLAIALVTQF